MKLKKSHFTYTGTHMVVYEVIDTELSYTVVVLCSVRFTELLNVFPVCMAV
jgi:hypothetical protein